MPYYRRLRDMREDHDLTQRGLGEKLGMSHSQYLNYEKGHRDVPTTVLIALAQLYGTSVDYLLGLTDDPTPPAKAK